LRRLILVAAVIVLLSGCATGSPSTPPGPVLSQGPSAAETSTVVVPDLFGLDGASAAEKVTGLTVTFDAGAAGPVLVRSDWQVTGQSVPAGAQAESGSEIVLTVTRPQSTPEAGPGAEKEELRREASAYEACRRHADTHAGPSSAVDWPSSPDWSAGEIEKGKWFVHAAVTVQDGPGESKADVMCSLSLQNDEFEVTDYFIIKK
jgi:hypothetical protein